MSDPQPRPLSDTALAITRECDQLDDVRDLAAIIAHAQQRIATIKAHAREVLRAELADQAAKAGFDLADLLAKPKRGRQRRSDAAPHA